MMVSCFRHSTILKKILYQEIYLVIYLENSEIQLCHKIYIYKKKNHLSNCRIDMAK